MWQQGPGGSDISHPSLRQLHRPETFASTSQSSLSPSPSHRHLNTLTATSDATLNPSPNHRQHDLASASMSQSSLSQDDEGFFRRKSHHSAEVVSQALAALREGASTVQVSMAMNIPLRTLSRWRKRDQEARGIRATGSGQLRDPELWSGSGLAQDGSPAQQAGSVAQLAQSGLPAQAQMPQLIPLQTSQIQNQENQGINQMSPPIVSIDLDSENDDDTLDGLNDIL